MALHHARHGEVVHLPALADDSRSTALVKTEQFEAIHLVVSARSTIPKHRVAGQAMLHCLRGRVRLTLESGDVTLEADDWLYLEAAADHGVEGLEDSEILLTILFERSTG